MLPALPLDEAGKYVAAAYIVFVLLIFVYVAIMASRLSRIEREVVELADLVEARDKSAAAASERAKEPVAQ
jgi:CcmD family protein